MRLTTCPTSEQLSHYLRGELSDIELDDIANHVGHCGDCDSAIAELEQSDDSLMRALRQPEAIDPGFEREAELQRALAAVRADYSAVDDPGTAGTILGNVREYDLLEKIGQGGMGTVYKALHSRLKRIVALKLLADHRLGDPAAVDRFSREMQAVGKLAHPNIVRALDAGEAEGRHYLVMEYIDGIDLSRLSRRCGPLPIAEACELVLQAALALQHAHEHNLVHRDMKPSNVMLTRDGQVKLLDLGIALLHPDEPATNDLTGTGQVMGTLDYMAPEQLDNTHAVDIRADVYGLGATLYKLLCGSAPATDSQSRFRLPGDEIPPVPNIRTIRGDVPKPVAAVLEKMLAPNPDQRYATPADVADALKPFTAKSNLKQLSLAAASDTPPRPTSPKNHIGGRLGRFALTAMALLLFALTGFAIYVETDQGQIVIHSSVDDVQVLVKRTGQLYDALDELEVDKGDNQWKFRSGSYEVQLLGDTDGLRVKDGVFTLTRGGKAVVTVERMAAGEKKTATVSVPVYDGKTFNEWIKLLKNDKSPQRQIEGIKALAAFGKNGESEVALETIFNIAASHSRVVQSDEDELVINTAFTAIPRVSDLETAFKFVGQKLDSDDVGERELALKALNDVTALSSKFNKGQVGEFKKQTVEKLLKLADDPEQRVRLKLIDTLAWNIGKPAVPTLVRMYEKDRDESVRSKAFENLAFMGNDASGALHLFLAAVSSPDSKIRVLVRNAFQFMKPDPKLFNEAMLNALGSENHAVRRDVPKYVDAYLEPLNISSQPSETSTEIFPVLMAAIKNDDKAVRDSAKELLAELLKNPQAITQALVIELENAGERERVLIIEAILESDQIATLRQQNSPVIEELIRFYAKADAKRRLVILQIIKLFGRKAEPARSMVEKALKDKDPQVRDAAEKALEALNPRTRKPEPVMIQEEYAPKTKKPAPAPASSGPVYEGRTFAEWVAILKSDDRSPQRRFDGVKALAALHTDKNADLALATILEKGQDYYAEAEAEDRLKMVRAMGDALKQIGDDRAAPHLSKLLTSEDPAHRQFGLTMLAQVKLTDELVPQVLKLAKDPDAQVRMKVVSQLDRVGKAGLQTLITMIENDESPEVRQQAAIGLGQFKEAGHAGLPALLELYKTSENDVRTSLLSALRKIKIYDEPIQRLLQQEMASSDRRVASTAEFVNRELSEKGWRQIPSPEEFGMAVYKGKTFSEWLEYLKTNKGAKERIEAIDALSHMMRQKTDESLDPMIDLLIEIGSEHVDDDLTPSGRGSGRYQARTVLGMVRNALRFTKSENSMPKLIATLNSEDAAKRRFALVMLPYFEKLRFTTEQITQVLKLAEDAEEEIRLACVEVLKKLQLSQEQAEQTLKLAEDPNEQVRLASVELLVRAGDPGKAAVESLVETDSSSAVRRHAAMYLSFYKEMSNQFVTKLVKRYDSYDDERRIELLSILGQFKVFNEEVDSVLAKAASSNNQKLKREAFKTWMVLKNNGLTPPGVERPTWMASLAPSESGKEETFTINVAADGKLSVGEKSCSLDELNQFLAERIKQAGKDGLTVRIIAAEEVKFADLEKVIQLCKKSGVRKVTLGTTEISAPGYKDGGAVYDGKTYGEWVTLLKTDRSAQRQLEGIKALAALRSEENTAAVVETIIKIAADGNRIETARDNPKVADVAATILKQIGPDPTGPALLAALQSEDIQTRRFAASALEQFEVTEAMIPAILKLPADPDEKVRYLSTRLLRQAGEPGVDALAKMVENDASLSIRARAAASLGVLKQEAKRATPELLNALLSSNAQIRLSAISSLRHIKPDQKLLNDALLKFIAEDATIVIGRRYYDPFELVDENSVETLPALIAGVVNDDEQIQRSAGRSFRNLKAAPEEVIPVLLEAAQDKTIKNKFELIKKIAHYHDKARAAMPALIKLYATGDKNNRHILLYAFEQIDLEHKDVRPLLLEAAQSDDEFLAKEAKKLLEVLAKRAEPVALSIKITADGQFDVGGESFDWDGLKSFLAEQVKLAGLQGVQVRVEAAGNVSYATFSAVIELCKPLGVQIAIPGKRLATPPVKNDQDAVSDDAK